MSQAWSSPRHRPPPSNPALRSTRAQTTPDPAAQGTNYTIATTEELAYRAKNLLWALFEHSGNGPFGSSMWKGKMILVTAASGGVGVWIGSEEGNKVDLVIDCVGGSALENSWWCLKETGTIIGIVQAPGERRPVGLDLPDAVAKFFIMSPSGKDLEEVTKLIEAGECWPVVDSVWALEQFEHGYARLDSGHARGKVVFDLTLNVPK
ncbi:zinc-binding dehydrogenase-domain-containing protein [Aspergillus californicus]